MSYRCNAIERRWRLSSSFDYIEAMFSKQRAREYHIIMSRRRMLVEAIDCLRRIRW